MARAVLEPASVSARAHFAPLRCTLWVHLPGKAGAGVRLVQECAYTAAGTSVYAARRRRMLDAGEGAVARRAVAVPQWRQ